MDLLTGLRDALGASQVLTGADAQPYLTDWRGRYTGAAQAVVRPGSTAQVAQVVHLCRRHGASIVPQGGNTGLAGGATPDVDGRAVVVSTRRLDRLRAVDAGNDTITVEAGCTLQAVQQWARDAGRLYPLSLASEGSCTVGGNLATNAGGTQVLRYGNARELALGLEVVTAEGDIWHGLRGLRKDNTGYDLRDLYIGSEGTLGIITAATLRLYPLPVAQRTALVSLSTLAAAVALLPRARAGFGAALTGFEVMSHASLEVVVRAFPQQTLPLGPAPWYALLELSDSESDAHAQARFEAVLEAALNEGLLLDAAVAGSLAQSQALWQLRESISSAQSWEGKNIKHDISVPASRIPDFVAATDALLQQAIPGVRHIIFGHLGDGNLHYNVSRPPEVPEADFLARQDEVYLLVHDSVHAHGGSISAEHGIGQLKRDELLRYKDGVELGLMHRIKQALDPLGLMNPGKVLAPR
ncbi:putative FAD-linked oxidoreductase [Pigmentiphaga humi]|uniref:Putative FAD-linked oxidoreductase n=1 Tax=Pigmentiphaga humi TaxID=2478468 RepID=A0A3P4B7Y0_9BURK|nr:FAD-binding oxidoreductase [Pigmentiphaga humi]VCU72152.1 putative FAD-linked oxidoreductase [Pigmentiphaga humi]